MKFHYSRYVLVLFLFISSMHVYSAEVANNNYIKVNNILSFFEFEELRSYVWENGDRKTYCPNYDDNPHYTLVEDETEIYFNPTVESESLSDSDYNVMYIVTQLKGNPFNYYLYLNKDGNVYLYDYKNNIASEQLKIEILGRLREVISAFKNVLK